MRTKGERPAQLRRGLPRFAVLLLFVLVSAVWLYYTPPGLLGKADAIGYAVCHRIDVRSFHLGERSLPLCSRCTGTYVGVAAALAYLSLRHPCAAQFPRRASLAGLGLFVAGFAIDGTNSYLHFFPNAPHLYAPTNTLRLITGTYFGMALATLVYVGFHQSVWQTPSPQPALPSLWDLMAYVILGLVAILLVRSEIALVLYPLALISSGAVLLMFILVYTMVTLIMLRRENQAKRWRDLILPVGLGIVLAIVQIGVIDAARYWLTGTWNGFQL